MAWYFIIPLFLFSCFLLSSVSAIVVDSLALVARYLKWREFVIAFFIMAFAFSLPNLFVDTNAVFQGKPDFAVGDIIGGNLVDLTIILALAVFFSKKGLSADSDMVQKSAIFTSAIAVLPLLLLWDGKLGRADGLILIGAFILYSLWLFSKKARFKKVYHMQQKHAINDTKSLLKIIAKVVILLIILLLASKIVIFSAQFFAEKLGMPLALVGIIIMGIGNSLPEAYFSILAAKKQENWLVLGDLMGSVIVCSTLVLGLIGLLFPFQINDLSPFVNARFFMIIAALLSWLFISTNKKITKKEGILLLFIYIVFLIVEIFISGR